MGTHSAIAFDQNFKGLVRFILLGGFCLWLLPFTAQAQTPAPEPLTLGQSLERELAGGRDARYALSLQAGQYVKVLVEQRGIGVIVELLGPDGKRLMSVNSERGETGMEELMAVAAVTAVHQVRISNRSKTTPPGRYVVTFAELHEASETERALTKAEWLMDQSIRVRLQGKFDEALSLAQESLALREKYLPPADVRIAASLAAMGTILFAQGKLTEAETTHQRALSIRRNAKGEVHPYVADSSLSLGNLYYRKGDLERAERFFLQALDIWEKTFSPEHEDIGTVTDGLGRLYRAKKDYPQAERMLLRALRVTEALYGPDVADVATSVNNLANIYRDQGDFARAGPMYERALRIYEKELGAEHFNVAITLQNLAAVAHKTGNYSLAEQRYQQSFALYEKNYGASNPALTVPLLNFVTFYLDRKEVEKAIPLMARDLAINEDYLRHNLGAGSEQQKLNWLATFQPHYQAALSLHTQIAPDNTSALELALTAVLRFKGRSLDAMNDTIALLRQRASGETQPLFDQLAQARAQYSMVVMRPPFRNNSTSLPQQLQQLKEQLEQLEAKLSAHSVAFGMETQDLSLNELQRAIPERAALLEFVVYTPYRIGTTPPARYAVYVLRKDAAPAWQDLGEAAMIDRAVNEWRETLQDWRRTDFQTKARALDALVLQPVRKLLGNADHLLIAPDGGLNLVPFAALVDEQRQYLLQRYRLTYLTSGRDLLRLQAKQNANRNAVILADPTFGAAANASDISLRDIVKKLSPSSNAPTEAATINAPINWQTLEFKRLKETSREATSIKSLLPQAQLLTQERATEDALKALHRPNLLHVATHGYFLSDAEAKAARISNPLLRSGLVLAGANARSSGKDDGILTAMEAAGLDLWGTKLVVLSACKTGLGEVKAGDGVYGLRRAFVLAGSESQVMSLWSVDDQGTRELMVKYYRRLLQGKGRGEALRQVQLELLNTPRRKHPFYWASFIQSGEWANLDGRR